MKTFVPVLLAGLCGPAQAQSIIVVDYNNARLELHQPGKEAANFAVGLPRTTPKGLPFSGKVMGAQINPSWRPTKATREYYLRAKKIALPEILPPGDPRNGLGAAKIDIKYDEGSAMNPLVKIHGTNDPKSIGQRLSRGCIRLRNADVLRLIELIRGQSVRVEFR